MRVLLILLVVSCSVSCVKDEPTISINDLLGRLLTCDSIKVTDNGSEAVIRKGRGTGLDIMFDTARTYIVYSMPEQVYAYRLRKSKIYYWKKRTDPHHGDFKTIINKFSNQLWLEYTDPTTTVKTVYYYTAD